MEFSSAHGIPRVRRGEVWLSDPLLEGGKLRDRFRGALQSICYTVKTEKHDWWVSPSGLWEDVKKIQVPGSLCLTNHKTWVSVNEDAHLYEEYIHIKSNIYFCR